MMIRHQFKPRKRGRYYCAICKRGNRHRNHRVLDPGSVEAILEEDSNRIIGNIVSSTVSRKSPFLDLLKMKKYPIHAPPNLVSSAGAITHLDPHAFVASSIAERHGLCVVCGRMDHDDIHSAAAFHKSKSGAFHDTVQLQFLSDQRQEGGNHYKRLTVQPFDLIKAMEPSGDAFVDYSRGCVIKYAARKKGDTKTMAEDLRKAAHYATAAAEHLEKGLDVKPDPE